MLDTLHLLYELKQFLIPQDSFMSYYLYVLYNIYKYVYI